MHKPSANKELFIKMVLSAWDKENNNLEQLINALSDEQLKKEIAPGKNTGVYLLGHLIAISDAMLPLLGFGEKLYPELEELFVTKPDKSGLQKPSITELKQMLTAVNKNLSAHIQSSSADEWFTRHNAVSAEDFAKEPHRNKLNVIINRTCHMANHIGQMLLLK
jgi:gamma-glutamylcysteine synthetase